MKSRFTDARFIARLFWGLALTAIAVWSLIPSYDVGWDVHVYTNAIASIRAGHDPYADAIAVQTDYQAKACAYQAGCPIPYSYVYSPITLPVLRAAAKLPFWLSGSVYWPVYFALTFLTIWIGFQFVERSEYAPFAMISSVAIFFPGMLENDALFSGNVAYLLYGMAFGAALLGWRRGTWGWFYAAVLLAGCFKAPMLTLLAIPVLSARRQWTKAGLTAAAGMTIFLLQPRIWPELFLHYMQAVELQFSYNRDFSSSPAGLVANALFTVVPYKITSLVAYLAYGSVVAMILFYFSRRFLAGQISLRQFAPVLLVGVLLLNPRLMEYDVAPITLLMTLIMWRFFAKGRTLWKTAAWLAGFFAVINLLAAHEHYGLTNPPWKLTEGCTLVVVFAAGVWNLRRAMQEHERKTHEQTEEQLVLAR